MKNHNLDLKAKQTNIARLHKLISDKIFFPGHHYIISCRDSSLIRNYKVSSILVWNSVANEIDILLEDISKNESKELIRRQKSTYRSIKFCMEAVADLHHLREKPSQIETFFGGYDNYRKALKEKNTATVAKFLRKTGQLEVGTTKRVKKAFPLYQQAYAMACMHAHLSAIGIIIEAREKEKVVNDLLSNTINAIGVALIKLIELTSDNVSSNISEEARRELPNSIQDTIKRLQ